MQTVINTLKLLKPLIVYDCMKGSPLSPLHSVIHKVKPLSGFPTAATALSEDSDSPVSDATMRDDVMSCSV